MAKRVIDYAACPVCGAEIEKPCEGRRTHPERINAARVARMWQRIQAAMDEEDEWDDNFNPPFVVFG